MKRLLLLLSILTISNKKNIQYCDIKGNIINPGVYEIKDNYTIKDVINDAGGLKDNSYTDNINLSKKVSDEMVIYINTKQEIEIIKKLNECNCSPEYLFIDCENNNIEKENNKIITTTKNIIIDKSTTTKINKTTTLKFNITNESTTKTTMTKNKQDNINTDNKLININTCTLEELMTLKGLGEKKATKIIDYRKQYGLFNNISDIMNVSGIGESTYNAIKEFIEV